MSQELRGGEWRVSRPSGDTKAWIVESVAEPPVRLLVTGYRGPVLPAVLHDVEVLREPSPPGARRWRLRALEGEFEFAAGSVERHEPLPGLFDPMLAPHALRPRDRRVVGVLLGLLRLPGGAWLLRSWHAARR
jgi:hypothetical protein